MDISRRFWEDALVEEVRSIISIDSEEEAKEIIEEFLVPDKISPWKFLGNCEALLAGGMSRGVMEIMGVEEGHEPTPSVSEFTSVLDRPLFVGLWFIAGYPDVLLWYKKELRRYKSIYGRDEDGLARFIAEFFGLDLTDADSEERMDEFVDSKGNPTWKSLRSLVRSYKQETRRELETTF